MVFHVEQRTNLFDNYFLSPTSSYTLKQMEKKKKCLSEHRREETKETKKKVEV